MSSRKAAVREIATKAWALLTAEEQAVVTTLAKHRARAVVRQGSRAARPHVAAARSHVGAMLKTVDAILGLLDDGDPRR